jgi:HD-GYP domain-containing protein (c-di-GMP phosphodiesterase class II)
MKSVLGAVRHHHERWDGLGYPKGLRGDRIPRLARIVAIADAYDAMVSDRPYRVALSHEQAFAELRRGRGTHFDPEMVPVFLGLDFRAFEALRGAEQVQGGGAGQRRSSSDECSNRAA